VHELSRLTTDIRCCSITYAPESTCQAGVQPQPTWLGKQQNLQVHSVTKTPNAQSVFNVRWTRVRLQVREQAQQAQGELLARQALHACAQRHLALSVTCI